MIPLITLVKNEKTGEYEEIDSEEKRYKLKNILDNIEVRGRKL